MVSLIQNAVVTLLQNKLPIVAPIGYKAPKKVSPYGGELTDLNCLLATIPNVLVDVMEGDFKNLDSAYTRFKPDAVRVELICCSANAAQGSANFADGLALVDWVFWAIKGESIEVADFRLQLARDFEFKRLASQKSIWVGVITLNLYT